MPASRRLLPALVLAACAALAHAQPADADRQEALRAFADAYGIARVWPRMAPKVARESLPRLREAAAADLAADRRDDAPARARLDALVPAALPRLEQALRGLDAGEFAEYAAFEVYAKAFETDEIRAMTAFFASPAGRKLTEEGTGPIAGGARAASAAAFSPGEAREVAAFLDSEPGRKMREHALELRDALHRHFVERSEPALQQLARELATRAETGADD